MPTPFDRYPPAHTLAVRDPSRPWWVTVPGGWIRPDGARVSTRPGQRPFGWIVEASSGDGFVAQSDLAADEHVTAYVDRHWPAPLPPLVVGQVWVTETAEIAILTVGRTTDEDDVAVVVLPDDEGVPTLTPLPREAFLGAWLVRGDFSPWAPPVPSGHPSRTESERIDLDAEADLQRPLPSAAEAEALLGIDEVEP